MTVLLIGGGILLAGSMQMAMAHGSMVTPPSRVYNCKLEGPETPQSSACIAAVNAAGTGQLYNWMGIRQGNANGQHQLVVPDGQLCSGGDPQNFGGMDLVRDDWVSTALPTTGENFEFIFDATAPHATAYHDLYVTKDGYDFNQPLKWGDLEIFCELGASGPESTIRMNCPLPVNKSGRHVIYHVWQRSDSTEAFYTCVDVIFGQDNGGGGGGGDPEVCGGVFPWVAGQTYTNGDQVEFNRKRYQANWWSRNRQPDLFSGPWQEWTDLGNCP